MNPWIKWYPTDWRADPPLRMCSLSARGLWIEMLGYMHEAEPYGHLVIGGKSPTPQQLAGLVGADLRSVNAGIVELEGAGVFSRTATGVIFNRRMTRDRAKAELDRENGKTGGSPLVKRGVNPPVDPPPNQPPTPQRPEARSQKPETSPTEALRESAGADAPPTRRATRLPDDWQLPSAWLEWALQSRPDWRADDVRRVALKFRNHWTAKSGANATKLSWERTWQNWVLQERAPPVAASLAVRRVEGVDRIINLARKTDAIDGTAERVDQPAIQSLPGDLRQQG